MKKLFTTILMMGVALCGWATITSEYAEGTKTLTINYVNDGTDQNPNWDEIIKPHMRNAEKIVLKGDWTNKDLAAGEKIEKIFEKCVTGPKKVYLDLSGCDNMRSSVKYTGEGDVDWISNNFIYLPDSNYPEQETVTGTATKVAKFYESWGAEYTGDTSSLEQHSDGLWYEPNTNWNGKTKKEVFVDENGKELPSDATVTDNGDETYSYSYTYTPPTDKFDLSKFKDKLNGLGFPNNAHFTAIPDDICKEMTELKNVTFGDNLVWIGKRAFKGCNNLNNVTFP